MCEFTPFGFESECNPYPSMDDLQCLHKEDSSFNFSDMVQVGGQFDAPCHSTVRL